MSQGELTRRRARSGGWGRHVLVFVMAIAGCAALGTLRDGGGEEAHVRLVLSTSAVTAHARTVSTTALYARNDPWKKYLASEAVCPGGERRDVSLARQAKTVACLVDYARRKRGLRALTVMPILSGASAEKARDIVRCATFAHNPCGGSWTSAVKSTGYAGSFGENLYLGDGPFGAPRPAVDAWLNSPPHRENLFRANWRKQGLAVVEVRRLGQYRDVAVFVSVLGSR